MNFASLYIQTEYSLLSSALRINELVIMAKQSGYHSLAITDLNNMHGVIKFYTKCKEEGIKPIIGLTLKIKGEGQTNHQMNRFNSHFLLYAKGEVGYKNLMKLTTLINFTQGLTLEEVSQHLDDIIVVLPGHENELINGIINHFDDCRALLSKYKNYLPEFYVGLDFQSTDMKNSFSDILSFCLENTIPCVALHKSNYLMPNDYDVYELLRMVDLNVKNYVSSEKERKAYFISHNSALDLFRGYPELINNTEKIANMCNLTLEFDQYHLPVYEPGLNGASYIKDLSIVGLKKRLLDTGVNKKEYQHYLIRLEYELDVVIKMGFCDYFLIVYDFIKYAKKKGILVGPGRGSGPGSLISYALGITEVDPIKYGLLFERFLNPERKSMPDIDTDFPDEDREDVIRYMGEKYTKNRVAHICTFGTYGPRLAIRDIVRVKEIDNVYLEEILRYVDSHAKSIEDCLASSEVFSKMANENDTIKEVVHLVKKMENLPRNLSIHAAGIIMADKDLVEYTPLLEGINGLSQTQFEASDLEKLGLVKFDFLGLKYLTIIDKITQHIKRGQPDFNIFKIPFDDTPTYQMLAKGDTNGIFQMESEGMRKTLMLLKVSSFIDIVNAIALYRPGPMEMIPSFCNRKFNKEKIDYLHEDLVEILEPTYGAIVYQEQILLIASKFAGYTLAGADILRRAISKKQANILFAERDKFVESSVKKGHNEALAKNIFEYIMKFANYGFNKSHSVAYSVICYQMAYLKSTYPKEFMAVTMSYTDKFASLKGCIMECEKMGIKVEIPSINKSTAQFVIEDNTIYYSLQRIAGIGEAIINNIILERNHGGLYQSYDDFIFRTKDVINRRNVEMLIYSGALDDFRIPRKELILEYDKSLPLANYGEMFKESLSVHEFGDEEFSFEDIANYERMALGFNLKYDIFKRYAQLRSQYQAILLGRLEAEMTCNIMFVIDKIKQIKTKKGDEMAFLVITDDSLTVDGVMFPNVYKIYKDNLVEGKFYFGQVKVEKRQEKLQVIFSKIHLKK